MRFLISSMIVLLASSSAIAQTQRSEAQKSSSVGMVGTRQGRDLANRVNPMTRINNRIESRISSRLDKNYRTNLPTANTVGKAVDAIRRPAAPR